MDVGEFECLDYVYVWTAPDYTSKVLSAEVHGLEPSLEDKSLFPSDHAAIKATIQLAHKMPVDLQQQLQEGQQQLGGRQQQGRQQQQGQKRGTAAAATSCL